MAQKSSVWYKRSLSHKQWRAQRKKAFEKRKRQKKKSLNLHNYTTASAMILLNKKNIQCSKIDRRFLLSQKAEQVVKAFMLKNQWKRTQINEKEHVHTTRALNKAHFVCVPFLLSVSFCDRHFCDTDRKLWLAFSSLLDSCRPSNSMEPQVLESKQIIMLPFIVTNSKHVKCSLVLDVNMETHHRMLMWQSCRTKCHWSVHTNYDRTAESRIDSAPDGTRGESGFSCFQANLAAFRDMPHWVDWHVLELFVIPHDHHYYFQWCE